MEGPKKSIQSTAPYKNKVAFVVLAIMIAVACCLFWMTRHGIRLRDEAADNMANQDLIAARPPPPSLPGELILKNYGASNRPEEDLTMMANAFSNLTLLIKGADPFRVGANEEFAAALRGRNRTQLRFLPDTHQAFNAQGQLVDRWKSPLFFHAVSHGRVDIRSAGPDRQMWTGDDLHRRYNGEFLRDGNLNRKSLFDEGPTEQTGR
jgi:hypothetical protein